MRPWRAQKSSRSCRRASEYCLDAGANALEQRGHVQEIIGRRDADFVGKLREVHGHCEDACPRQARQQQNPRSGETKRQVMKHAIRHIARPHQFIEARLGAGKHVIEIPNRKHHAFGFAGSPRRVQNGDRVLRRKGGGRGRRARCGRRIGAENFVKQHKPRRIRPRRRDRIAKRRIAAANQAGPGVAQHRGQFARGLTSVHRNGDESLRDNREIERGPPDTVRCDQRATVSLRKS